MLEIHYMQLHVVLLIRDYLFLHGILYSSSMILLWWYCYRLIHDMVELLGCKTILINRVVFLGH